MNQEKIIWHRVTKADPCEICGKPDWCGYSDKGAACMRIESPKMLPNGAYWHPFDAPAAARVVHRVKALPAPAPRIDCGAIMREWRQNAAGAALGAMAKALGVSWQSLEWLGVTWAEERKAMAFPMHDATGHNQETPCGIRLRTNDGKKFAVTGSRSGIFFPYGSLLKICSNRIFICEGPTDTAACLDMGLFAIGRASCCGGEDIVISALEQLGPAEAVVVCDNDGPGLEGADALMRAITLPKTRLVPPGKDLRSFHRDGGNRDIIEAMLRNTLRK